MNQDSLMKFCPATGQPNPYPSHATQWRHYRGNCAWLFNPWTGTPRTAEDVGTDTFGYLIRVFGEQLQAEPVGGVYGTSGEHPGSTEDGQSLLAVARNNRHGLA